jgi:hypothetical protein
MQYIQFQVMSFATYSEHSSPLYCVLSFYCIQLYTKSKSVEMAHELFVYTQTLE